MCAQGSQGSDISIFLTPLREGEHSSIPSKVEEGPSPTIPYIHGWIKEHQDDKTGYILTDIRFGDSYKFEASFLFFMLDGIIDLSTNSLSDGNLYVVAPIWGRVVLVEDINGNLDSPITCQFKRGPKNFGQISLSLDSSEDNHFVIEYDVNTSFVGDANDRIPLFKLPKPESPRSLAKIDITAFPTTLVRDTYTEGQKLFDEFIEKYLDKESFNIVMHSYQASQAYSFHVSLLSIFELEGVIDSSLSLRTRLYIRMPTWARVRVATISAGLKPGIRMTVEVELAKGDLCIYLKGSELWVKVDLNVTYIGPLMDEGKLFTLPAGFVM